MRVAVPFLFLAFACSGPRSTPTSLRPSDVAEYAALPAGYTLEERVSEHCVGSRGLRPIRDESLLDVDCSRERLARTLRAHAAQRGTRAIVDRSCRARGRDRFKIECWAWLARPSSSVALGPALVAENGPAPSPARVQDLDEPHPEQAREIRVSFEPSPRARRWPERAYDRVAETVGAAVGRADLGQVSAQCAACDDAALRHALRVTAGRQGAGELASVRCFSDEDRRCVATALEPWSF